MRREYKINKIYLQIAQCSELRFAIGIELIKNIANRKQ